MSDDILTLDECGTCRSPFPAAAMAGDPLTCAGCLLAELEAVRETQLRGCECATDEACAFVRERDKARADLDALQARYDAMGRTLQRAVEERDAALRAVEEAKVKQEERP